MTVVTEGWYAIVEDNGTFREWRYLVNADVDTNNVWPQIVDAQPAFDPDTQFLTEGVPSVDQGSHVVHKTWVVNAIDLDITGNPKAFMIEILDLPPSPNAAQIERHRIGELLRTAAKASLENMELWVRLHFGSELLREGQDYKLRQPANDNGFYFALIGLATAAALTAAERSTLNARLKVHNLRRVL